MKNQLQPQYLARATILKALAHPTRLFIIDELEKQERCVGELTELIGADFSTVSKHLSILKNAGLIQDDKRGNSIFYNLKVPCVTDFFTCIETVLESNMNSQMEIVQCCKKK